MYKILLIGLLLLGLGSPVYAETMDSYIVKPGDSMWKIAVKYQIGVSEIINANKDVKNPNLIYPKQKLNVPNLDNLKSFENQVISLTNQERAKAGIPGLQTDWELSRVARHKSEEMSNLKYFSHTSPKYGSPFDMMKAFGIQYKTAGENIAQGQSSPDSVVKSWMNSPGHRQNILSPNYTHIGVGFSSNGNYWTQQFISK
jgi:uncharacterized YkwD family protein/spore coat assembly protein SafA